MTRAARYLFAAAIAALACAAASPAALAAPYTLSAPVFGDLAVTASGSTLALDVVRDGGFVRLMPGTTGSLPFGCFGDASSIACFEGALASSLTLTGETLEVDVRGVSTANLTLTGGGGDDMLRVAGPGPLESGTLTRLVLAPGAGNDLVSVGGTVKELALTADPGDDRYEITTDTLDAGDLDLGTGNDVASSASRDTTLRGGAGNDTLSGAGPLDGGDGSDLLQPTELGRSVDGGGGATHLDRLSYELLPTGVTATRTSATQVSVATDLAPKTNIELLEGSPFGDTLIGHAERDVLFGGGGADLLDGRGGGDILDGGPGYNTVTYEAAPAPAVVNLATGSGSAAGVADTLTSIRGVVGGLGNDVVTGGSADESVSLGAGDDQVDLGDGYDSASGGIGDDLLRGGDGNDTLDGGDGTDTATYDERGASEPVTVTLATPGGDGATGESDTLLAIENLTGGASNDALTGDDGPNVLLGGPGLNTLDGLGGADRIVGGPARDTIVGGKGADQLFGEGDDDSIAAFDGEIDVVSCGASLDDDAQVDAGDQVDGCEFASRGDVPVPVDGDGDGFVGGFDCNDTNKGISPGAVDVPGDGIDQNCDGFDEAVPFVDYGLALTISREHPRGRKITKFIVSKLPADHRVLVTCKGTTRAITRRCPFRRATRKPAAGRQVVLTPLFKKRRLSPGTTIEMQVTAPSYNGRALRIPIRKAGPIRTRRLCIIAPRKAPRTCPEGDE